MKTKFYELLEACLDVKSVVTLLLTIGYIILTVSGTAEANQYYQLYQIIVIFWFGSVSSPKKAP